MPPLTTIPCPVCSNPLTPIPRRPWLFRCSACRHWASTLAPAIDSLADKDALDQSSMTAALEPLRRANYARILERLARLVPGHNKKLLDVGCSSGLFLDLAQAHGFHPMGLEPDATIVHRVRAATPPGTPPKNILQGYFPDALPNTSPADRFDIITFNDVLEHIPNPRHILHACHALLNPGGILMINIPNSQGFLFRTANLLDRAGLHKPLDRLWQVGFRSPHLHYFRPAGLARIAAEQQFKQVASLSLHTVRIRGLWNRLTADKSASRPFSAAAYLGVLATTPLLRALPDITALFFQK